MWHDTKWISLNLHRQTFGNCKHTKLHKLANNTMGYVSSMFSFMSLFALQRCNLTHREMTIAGRLMGANNRGITSYQFSVISTHLHGAVTLPASC